MPKREVLEDWYGTKVRVQLARLRSNVMIHLEFWRGRAKDDWVRLTPDQARKLAKQLEEAAEEAESRA